MKATCAHASRFGFLHDRRRSSGRVRGRMSRRRWSTVAATCVVMLACITAGAVAAGASPAPVPAGGRRPETPAISGRYAVWADRQGGSYDILMFDAYTRVTQAVSSSSADEIQPAIQGDRVVYATYANGDADIYLYDIPSGIVSPVCVAAGDQINPSIWGNTIVWEDYRSGYNPAIYGYNLATRSEFLVESGYSRPKKRPKVAGDLVVWEDYSGQAGGRMDADIRVKNLAAGTYATLTGTGSNELVPATDGRYVVWAQAAAKGLDIRAYDTVTGVYTDVRKQVGEQTFPTVGDGVVYWIDNSGGPRLHADAYSLPLRRNLAFDDRGTGDIGAITAQGSGIAWLERNANRWQVRVLAGWSPMAASGLRSAAYTWSPTRIRAATPVDRTAPTVASTSVRQGSVNVRAGEFTLYFSEALDKATAESGVRLTDASGSDVSAEVTYSAARRSVTVRPRLTLAAGSYALRVSPVVRDRAGNAVGTVPPVTFSTGPKLADTVPPSTPDRPVARVEGLTSVTVSWRASVDDVGVIGYRVYRYMWVTGTPSQVASYTGSQCSTSIANTATETVPAKYTYYYAIRAVDASGNVSATSALASPDPHGTYVSGYQVANCLNCHSVHGSVNNTGALGAKTAAACYECHGATSGTRIWGYGSTYDTQGNFGDDSVIATYGPLYVNRYVHRNSYMAAIQRECDSCHTPHRRPATTGPDPSPGNAYNKLLRTQLTTPSATYRYNSYTTAVANTFCFDCHGNGTTDDAVTKIGIVGGATAYTNAGGDHRTTWNPVYNRHADVAYVASTSSNPGIQCEACHDQHGSPADALLGIYSTTDGKSYIGSVEITANNFSVCYGCHTSATVAKSVTASGYPVDGGWPGKAVYTTPYNAGTNTGSMHGTGSPNATSATYPAPGDCRMCHDMHGTANRYDMLVGGTTTTPNFSPGSATFCFAGCHDGSRAVVDDDIKRYWPVAAGGTSADARSGHRTLSNGVLPAGSAMPCYYCHNPHGSASAYGLLVITRSAGATLTIGDAAGEIVMTSTPTAAAVRQFCFTCHTTAIGNTGWNGSAMASVTAPALVAGIDRTTYSASGAHLCLPPVNGHYLADTASCYSCHGRDYATATSNNVHNPSGGSSSGGSKCYSCHNWQSSMETTWGATRTNTYHHALGSNTASGDVAPNTGAYPTNPQDVHCVSCHTDHNYFNSPANPAANLRQDATNSNGSVTTNSDFMATNNQGVCLSCHVNVRTRDNVNQKADAARPTLSAINGADYKGSSHQYMVTGTVGGQNFFANCAKCHDDEQDAGSMFTSTYKFGTHYSAERNILSALGGSLVDPLEQNECFICHRGDVAGNDYYGAKAMSQAGRRIETVFKKASSHPVTSNASGSNVACVGCHNVHEESPASKVSSPTDMYTSVGYSTDAEKNAFCLNCHDGSAPAARVTSPTLVMTPTLIAAGRAPYVDQDNYQAESHWIAHDSIATTETQACDKCHDNHGSAAPKLLGGYQAASNVNTIAALTVTANDTGVCAACHNAAAVNFPAQSRPSLTASFYPTDGSWPGMTTYAARSPHSTATANILWPDFQASNPYASGDCKQCHEVHGTENPLDELRGTVSTSTYVPGTYTFCFTCHDGAPAGTNIKGLYPASAGGNSADSGGRAGHKTISTTGTVIAGGQAVPCYACHNPHGSGETTYGLQVVTQFNGTTVTVGDTTGEIDMGTAAGVRRFCFACHASSVGNTGWNGSAWTSVTAADRAVGFSRITSQPAGSATGPHLRLPMVNGHLVGDTASCYGCHVDPHEPSGGISNGGTPCYQCHQWQSSMETTYGATRTNTYHHALGSNTASGDVAPNTGAYPTNPQDVHCVSCHTDHNYFNSPANPAANLRQDATNSNGSVTTNSDFMATNNQGVCLSCHVNVRTRDNVNQKADAARPTLSAINGADYKGSSHQYMVTGTVGGQNFFANCAKCHDDEQDAGSMFTSTYKFGTHYSAERNILSALGGSLVDPLEQNECFICHRGDVAGNDYYGAKAMSQAGRRIETVFKKASSHPVTSNASGSNVACVGCHNVHEESPASKVSSPTDMYTSVGYSTDAEKNAFCLNCHDGSAPAARVTSPTLVMTPTLIAAGRAPYVDQDNYQAESHWIAHDSIATTETQACDKCHDNHGSAAPKLLGGYQAASNVNTIAALTVTANDTGVCAACHNAAAVNFPAQSRPSLTASFYPTDGSWPGMTTYAARSPHSTATANILWPDFQASNPYASGDCKQCHEVHGTENPLDELRGTVSTSTYGQSSATFCFTCHDGAPAADDIKSKFPNTLGGTSTGARSGHRTISTTGSVLAGGAPIPCYACHNPHGSAEITYGLLVVTQFSGPTTVVVGDGAGEIDVSTDAGVRKFCFACHTTAIGNSGWNGSAWTSAVAGIKALGFDRFTQSNPGQAVGPKLRLPMVNGHYQNDTKSCLGCHSDVHEPTGGGSNGNLPCYGCHAWKAEMDATGANKTVNFHHVMDNGVGGGDAAPGNATTYPVSASAVQCVSCHTDHNYFNGSSVTSPSANLRSSLGTQPSGSSPGTNTDFIPAGTPSYGICLDCHDTAFTKDTANQKSGGSTDLPAINPMNYAASAHSYTVNTTYGASSIFRASCSKCHDDENDADSKMTGTYKIGTHYSNESRLAKALGIINAGPGDTSEENLCWRCHTNANAGKDGYGQRPMSSAAASIAQVMTSTLGTYRHNVANTARVRRHTIEESVAAPANVASTTASAGWWGASNGNLHVECEDCHNVHEARVGTYMLNNSNADERRSVAVTISLANKGVWGVNINGAASGDWGGVGAFGSRIIPQYDKVAESAYEWQLCLKCHSKYAWGNQTIPTVITGGAPTTHGTAGITSPVVMTDVGADFSPKQFAIHPLFAPGKNQPTTATITYSKASGAVWSDVIVWNTSPARRSITPSSGLDHAFVDGWRANSRVTCSDCHGSSAVNALTDGPHGSANRWMMSGLNTGIKVTITGGTVEYANSALGATAPDNFCINCHRSSVYGTGEKGFPAGVQDGEALSRVGHSGAGLRDACNDGTLLPMAGFGCWACHGANNTDGEPKNGNIHGNSMAPGDNNNSDGTITSGGATNDPMGYRFMNGGAWESRIIAATSGNFTCYCNTNADSYSSCTQHASTSGAPNYYYALPTK
ncbi:MAG: hypothetical protein FDZ70_00305 [Actinobacteria bacterium]|nr:MAG: hypothetical protein FDZ70_00305 [Actinomycetota bacterium]